MKRAHKVLVVVAVAIAALAVASAVARRPLLRWAVARVVQARTGLEVGVGDVRGGLFPPSLVMRDFVIFNPPGFVDREAIRFREILIETPSGIWRRNEPRLRRVVLDASQITVVKTRDGVVNWQTIGRSMRRPQPAEPAPSPEPLPPVPPSPSEPSSAPSGPASDAPMPEAGVPPSAPSDQRAPPAPPPLRIDELTVRIGAIETREYAAGQTGPRVQRMALDMEHTVTNVVDAEAAGLEIAGVVAMRAAPLLVTQVMKTAGEDAMSEAWDSLQRNAARLLKKAADDPAVSNLLEKGAGELRRLLPGVF